MISTKTNVIFMFENEVDRAVLTASSEASRDLVVENLKTNSRTDEIWRSKPRVVPGALVNIDLKLDDTHELPPVSMLAMVDLNASSEATIRVRGWANGIESGTPTVDRTVSVFSALSGFGVGGYGEGGYGGGTLQSVVALSRPIALVYLGGWYSLKYWRVTITDPQNTYLQASRMYLGGYWQPENNFARGAVRQLLDRTQLMESVGGQEYGDDRRHRLQISAVTRGMKEGDADFLWTKYLQYRTSKPFIVSFRPTERQEQFFTTIWGRFDTNQITHQSFDNYDAVLNVREWL